MGVSRRPWHQKQRPPRKKASRNPPSPHSSRTLMSFSASLTSSHPSTTPSCTSPIWLIVMRPRHMLLCWLLRTLLHDARTLGSQLFTLRCVPPVATAPRHQAQVLSQHSVPLLALA